MPHRDDDFFVPRHVNEYEPCADDSSISSGDIVLPLGASLSLVCYVYLLWMYFGLKTPVFRRHPTTLAVYKCIIELMFILQYLWVPSVDNKQFYTDDLSGPTYSCRSSAYAAYLAFMTQFALFGSELCFFLISYDMRLAYTNPFSSYKENMSWFFWSVLGWSTFSALVLMALGPEVYGMSDLGLIWIQKKRRSSSANYPKGMLYYLMTIVVYVYSLWANFRFSVDSEKGFSKTVSNRLSIMKRSKKFTVGYVAYGSIVFLLQFVSYATKTESPIVVNAPAYLLAYRGVWGLAVILYSNYSELTWDQLNPFRLRLKPQEGMKEDVAMEKLLLQPHLNTALRAEILYFTTQGIMFAAKDYHRRAQARRAARSNPNGHATGAIGHGNGHGPEGGREEENEEEDSEFAITESPGAIGQTKSEPSKNRFSLKAALYGKRPLPPTSRPGATSPGTPSSPTSQISTDDGFDVGGMDLFSRQSVAIFERLNLEQSAAVNKEMEAAIIDETTPLGISKRASARLTNGGQQQQGNQRHSIDSVASATAANRTYNPFHMGRPASTRSPLQRTMSERGVELKPAGLTSLVRGNDGGEGNKHDVEAGGHNAAYDPSRESEVASDVVFDMDSNGRPAAAMDRYSTKTAPLPLWRRIESPPEMVRTPSSSSSSQASLERTMSTDSASGPHSYSRSSMLSSALRGALLHASDAARSFFASSQYRQFRFKDFCPKLFGKVRELSGIDNESYAKYFEKTCKEKFSEGRSGAFMFFSSNERFIVKTTTKSESLALHKVMPAYVAHLKDNPNSLVCRFLGSHCITMYGNELYFVVMLNVFPTVPLSERYDLKGSWVNRHGFEFSRKSKRERMRREPTTSSPLYQDNDLQHKISLELDVTFSLASQIRRDVLFLRSQSLMDYSLLIGVRRERFKVLDSNAAAADGQGDHRMSRVSSMRETDMSGINSSIVARPGHSSIVARPDGAMTAEALNTDAFKRDVDGGMRARLVEGPGTYYIGIIDILQEWNWNKKLERFLKIYFKRCDGDGISAIEPVTYSERFWRGAVLDTFDGLEYDTEEILLWKGDESGGEPPEPRESQF